jgi:hypothetical protein
MKEGKTKIPEGTTQLRNAATGEVKAVGVSEEYPVNSTAKVYYDMGGNEVTLRQLIRIQPEWAHSRIKACEAAEARIEALEGAIREHKGNMQCSTYDEEHPGNIKLWSILEGTNNE